MQVKEVQGEKNKKHICLPKSRGNNWKMMKRSVKSTWWNLRKSPMIMMQHLVHDYYILSYKHYTLYYHWFISWYSFRINDSSCLLCGFPYFVYTHYFFSRSHLKTRGLPRVYKLVSDKVVISKVLHTHL